NPTLFKSPDDTWSTHGRYNLSSRLLRGGLSGSGDVHHPANAVFKSPISPRLLPSFPAAAAFRLLSFDVRVSSSLILILIADLLLQKYPLVFAQTTTSAV
ncbi:unnamed protein product, partial [Heterotrigona itama]